MSSSHFDCSTGVWTRLGGGWRLIVNRAALPLGCAKGFGEFVARWPTSSVLRLATRTVAFQRGEGLLSIHVE
jgi:hypothetical protein